MPEDQITVNVRLTRAAAFRGHESSVSVSTPAGVHEDVVRHIIAAGEATALAIAPALGIAPWIPEEDVIDSGIIDDQIRDDALGVYVAPRHLSRLLADVRQALAECREHDCRSALSDLQEAERILSALVAGDNVALDNA